MTTKIIANDTDDQRQLAAELTAQADEWELIAAAIEAIPEDAEAERSAWQEEYKPRGVHKAKMGELGVGTAGLATQAREVAASLRAEAADILTHADRVDSGEADNVEVIEGIDTELDGKSGESAAPPPPASGSGSGSGEVFEV